MKKNLLFTLAVSALVLAACNNGPATSSTPATSTGEASASASASTPADTSNPEESSAEASSQAAVETIEIIVKDGSAVMYPSDATLLAAKINGVESKEVVWASSDEAVATVTTGGAVTAKALGEADITATAKADSSKVATFHVQVLTKVTALDQLDGSEKAVTVRGKVTAITSTSVFIDDGTAVLGLYWKTGSPNSSYTIGSVLTVTGDTTTYYGEIQIEMKDTVEVVIEEDVTIESTTADSPEELTAELLAQYATAGNYRAKPVTFVAEAVKGANDYVNWKIGDYLLSYQKKPSSMPTLIEGMEYTVKGYLASYNTSSSYFPVIAIEVTANSAISPVTSLQLDKTAVTVGVGDSDTVVATVLPEDAQQNVIWRSADPTIAKVFKGVITGVAVGTTKITATTEGVDADGNALTQEIDVTVTEAQLAVLPMTGDFTGVSSSSNELPYGWSASQSDVYSGGLKANKNGWWVLSREFEACNTGVVVGIKVGKLNAAQGSAPTGDTLFLVEGLNAEGAVVGTGKVFQASFMASEDATIYTARVNAAGITQVRVTLAERPANSEGGTYNLRIDEIAIQAGDWDPENVPDPTSVALDHETLELVAGREASLAVQVLPVDASQNVVWTSSDENVATVANGKVTAVAEGTATIRATAEGFEEVYAECVVTVTADEVNWGTLENPLTVTEANALINALDDGASTEVKMYVTGTVKSRVNNNAFWITDGTNDVEVYFYNLAEDVADPAVGDTIIAYGFGKKYVSGENVTLELSGPREDNVVIVSNSPASVAITLGDHEHATVTNLPEEAVNGSTVTFNVSADEGYQIYAVKVNGTGLSAGEVEGEYSFVVHGESVITVETVDDSYVETSLTIVADGFVTAAYADYEAVIGGVSWKADGTGNYGNGLQMRTNSTTGDSKIYNTSALSAPIAKVTINWNSSQSSTKNLLKLAFGNESQAEATEGVDVVYAAGQTSVEIIPEATDATYMNLFHTKTSGAIYIDSIVITFAAVE